MQGRRGNEEDERVDELSAPKQLSILYAKGSARQSRWPMSICSGMSTGGGMSTGSEMSTELSVSGCTHCVTSGHSGLDGHEAHLTDPVLPIGSDCLVKGSCQVFHKKAQPGQGRDVVFGC